MVTEVATIKTGLSIEINIFATKDFGYSAVYRSVGVDVQPSIFITTPTSSCPSEALAAEQSSYITYSNTLGSMKHLAAGERRDPVASSS